MYGHHDSELPLQETHRSYFWVRAFRRTCCEKATVGGKHDRPTSLCSLAEFAPAELLQRFDGLPEADASTRTRLTPLLRQFLPKWPDGNTCAGIRSTYSRWIGGNQLQGIVEPNG